MVTSVLPTQNEDRIAAKVRDARTLDTFYLFSTILIHCIIVKLFFVNFAPARMETILTSDFCVKYFHVTRDLLFPSRLLVTLQAARPLVGQAEGRTHYYWATDNIGTGNFFLAAPGEVA